MRVRLLVLMLLASASACTSDGSTLIVDLRTDLVPGEEFLAVETVLESSSGAQVARDDRVIRFGEPVIEGTRILSQSGLADGGYRLEVTLLDRSGMVLVQRVIRVPVSGDTGVTTLISRDARMCDPDACEEGSSCGHGPACADDACRPEDTVSCPAPQCMTASDCAPRAECSFPVCVVGVCFYGAVEGSCDAAEWCEPESGCVPRTGVDPPDGGVDAGGCPLGTADCDGLESNGCEMPVASDPRNCGGCGVRCEGGDRAMPGCDSSACYLICDTGYGDCNGEVADGCESDLAADEANCGACGSSCPTSLPLCAGEDCYAVPFESDGSEGALEPTGDMVLSAGVHHFTTIDIPAGVTVRVDGTGVLELYATGDVVIDGIIDVSGGPGGARTGDFIGQNGGGGHTGTGVAGAPGGAMDDPCRGAGLGGLGGPGMTGVGGCGAGGTNGGGAGGWNGGGGGGGGYAGGGGARGDGGDGGAGASTSGGTGGLTSTAGPGLGAEPALGPPYAGEDGRSESFGRHCGGGGSIGADAVADLVMTTTFRPGSGGGGGSGTWNSFIDGAGCGGGGGGGAVRVASITQISIGPSAAIRAVGGPGGSFTGGNGGGGGSGGAIYLSAPALNVMGTLDASGATRPAGGNGGGSGGMGRIRISTLPDRCAIAATTVPPMLDGCNPADMPGYAYVASYPF